MKRINQRLGVPMCFVVLSVLCPAATCRAELDPKVNTPYELQVVVHFDNQRRFAKVFQEHVKMQIGELLRQTYGSLARIEMASSHPLLEQLKKSGIENVFEETDKLGEVKTHFIIIDIEDGVYRIRARQYDGVTGIASPAIRTRTTHDRHLLARIAAQLIDRDFGVTGTVVRVDGERVDLHLQGGALTNSTEQRVKPGDVFAVSRVREVNGKQVAQRLPYGLLVVRQLPKLELCQCEYYHRFVGEELDQGNGAVGYRCRLLPATQSRLRMRLFDPKTSQPLANLQVHVGKDGYENEVRQMTTDDKGMITSPQAINRVAYITVMNGATKLATFPVPILGNDVVTARVALDPAALARGRLQFRYNRWMRRVYEDLYLAGERVERLNARLKKSPKAALTFANSGLAIMSRELESLYQEKVALKDLARSEKQPLDFTAGEQRLDELEARKTELTQFISQLQKAIAEEGSEKRKKIRAQLAEATLLEKQADYKRAIEIYEKVLQADADLPKVSAHLAALKSDWREKGAAHRQARKYLYEMWPAKKNTTELKAALPKVKEYFAICKKVGDHLTPRRMLQANLAHAVFLKKRLEILQPHAAKEDNRAELKIISVVAGELQDLHAEVNAWVEKAK